MSHSSITTTVSTTRRFHDTLHASILELPAANSANQGSAETDFRQATDCKVVLAIRTIMAGRNSERLGGKDKVWKVFYFIVVKTVSECE